ncbi:MAG: M20/M25/M40 family metallo-hydrolase [Leptonema sp. (in: bacteria)]
MKENTKKFFLFFLITLFLVLVLSSFIFPYFFFTSKEISLKDIILYHRYLTDDSLKGRYPNTVGSEKARNWILSFFKRWNYYPAFENSYFMEFTFLGKYIKTNTNKIEIVYCSQNCSAPIEPMGISPPGVIEGIVVDGNYCIEEKKEISSIVEKIRNPEKYILLCKRYGPEEDKNLKEFKKWISFENKYHNIDRFHFKGVIFLRDKGENITLEQMYFPKKGKTLAGFLDNVNYIDFYKEMNHSKPIRIHLHYEREKLKGKNLGFSLKPIKENQKVIYIGAHYDHLGTGIPEFSLGPTGEIYNGADDNASGVAGIMELAEYFTTQKIPEDWNLVFLFFDGEEWGLLGSKEFVNSKFFSQNAIAMLNFDMIGRYSQSLQIQGKDSGDDVWREILNSSLKKMESKYSLKVQLIPGASGPSDHTSFYEKKLPVLFFFTGTHKDYHKPSDDYSKINYEGMVAILELAKEILFIIINSKEIPKYNKVKEDKKTYSYKIRLGIIPTNYYSDDGLEVGGFIEDAPISKSGIQIGDKIIKIGNKEIKNIYDLMGFLQSAKLGIQYEIVYKRNQNIYKTYTELIGN